MKTTTARIVQRAFDLLDDGVEVCAAIDQAADEVATTPAQRRFAVRIALTALARAERLPPARPRLGVVR